MTPPAEQTPPAPGSRAPRVLRWCAFGTVALLLLLLTRHWHPVYHFTAFLQIAEDNDLPKISAIEKLPLALHPLAGGYDGQYYVQIACDPSVTSDELPAAADNISYRARRILAPAIAWLLGGGQPAWIIHTYSLINVVAWLVLAWIAWRLLAVADVRTFVAWSGLLFSAGALHSIRLSLTDLVALVFVAAAFFAAESKRPRLAAGLLALGGLGRETSLASVAGLWTGPWRSPRAWLNNAVLTAAVALPFALWLLYLHRLFPNIPANPSVLTIPGLGLWEKLNACVADIAHNNDPFLAWSTLLAVASLLVQAGYLVARPKPRDLWWRAALPCVVLMAVLDRAVWEGHPGAITRVVLPLQLGFNILAARHRAPLLLLLAGNLTIFSGLAPFRSAIVDARELGHGRVENAVIVVRTGYGWYGIERSFSQVRTWSQPVSKIQLQAWPAATNATASLAFKLRAFSSCHLTIRQDQTVLWQGPLTTEKRPVVLHGVRIENGRASLELSSDSPAHPEGPAPDARQLSFALYDLSVIAHRTP